MKSKLRGLSLRFDPYFIRNLTIILAAIFIWRGIWNLLDFYLFPGNIILSNIMSIALGIILLFIFDTEFDGRK